MSEQVLFSLAWLVGNVLDGLTTYLGIFRVSVELESKEWNPLIGKYIYTRFGGTMLVKGLLAMALLALIWFYPGLSDRVFILKVLSIIMGFIVLNNSYIYLSKRIRKRMVMTPGRFLTKVCHLPNTLAYGVFVVSTILVSHSIAKWI